MPNGREAPCPPTTGFGRSASLSFERRVKAIGLGATALPAASYRRLKDAFATRPYHLHHGTRFVRNPTH
ncbi:hypothetical protein EN873_44635 [bacterium M00.F.Ca.ET.230.01.1.1]|nr:hypothetical protein EN873_44635 [bacterium M00.F.Ca.ET.230.01.1.1]